MQFFFILVAPTTVVLKIIIDSSRPDATVQPFSSLDLQRYIGNYSMDLTSDETIWACIFGTLGLTAYRTCMDQVVTQRLLACRTIKDAKRTAVMSALLLFLMYMTGLAVGVALTIWFRGCDPGLQGKIARVDQILPYYVNTYLVHVPGFLGLFLAGIGAGIATLATIAYQILHVSRIIGSGRKPPRMDANLDFCPGNQSTLVATFNASKATHEATEESFVLFRISYMWTSFFAILATVVMGILVSWLTGEIRNKNTRLHLCNDGAVRLWRYARLLDDEEKVEIVKTTTHKEVMHDGRMEGDNLLASKDETCI
ncbi:hypothetical protein MTO96_031977 [Rhipicephalus appendiculatus]